MGFSYQRPMLAGLAFGLLAAAAPAMPPLTIGEDFVPTSGGGGPIHRRGRFKRRHQITQHQIVDADLVWIAPAIDQIRGFIERCVDEMGCTFKFRRCVRALRGIGQINLNMAGAMKFARLAPR